MASGACSLLRASANVLEMPGMWTRDSNDCSNSASSSASSAMMMAGPGALAECLASAERVDNESDRKCVAARACYGFLHARTATRTAKASHSAVWSEMPACALKS